MKAQEYNAGNASDWRLKRDLRKLLHRKPVSLALCEVHDRRHVLAWAARKYGYDHIQFPGAARGHCALLVRKDAKAHNERTIKIGEKTFVGREVAGAGDTGWTAEKHIVAADITGGMGQQVTVAAVHFVPSASHVRAASRLLEAQADACARWLRRQPLPTDLAGDCNGQSERHEFAQLRKAAVPLAAPSRKGAAIDIHWVTQGLGSAVALDGYSSDHKPVEAHIHWRQK